MTSFSVSFFSISTSRALLAASLLGACVYCDVVLASGNSDAGNPVHKAATSSVSSTTPQQNVKPHASVKSVNPVKPVKQVRPLWGELTASQKQALAPLASDWDKLDGWHKKKWLDLAAKSALMKPDDQHRLQDRMHEWAKLTPEQRRTARENYALAKRIGSQQKTEKWQQYQNLSTEEKKKLAAESVTKKRVANLPRPAPYKNKVVRPNSSPSKSTIVEPVPAVPVPSQVPPALP